MDSRAHTPRGPTKNVSIPLPLDEWRRLQFVASRLGTPMGRLLAPYVAVGLAELETRIAVEAEEAEAR